jgi:hypothetical protein
LKNKAFEEERITKIGWRTFVNSTTLESNKSLIKIALARDALKLSPSLAARMPIGANVAAAEPAVIGTILIRTEMPRGVDGALASPREEDHRRWRARGFGTRIEPLLTGLTQGFVEISGERFGLFGARAAGLVRLERHCRGGARSVGPPDMDEETTQHQSNH